MPIILSPYSFAPPSVAFQTSADANTQTITCPTVLAGDIGVLFDQASNNSGIPTDVIPSGFTKLKTSNPLSSFYRTTLSYKIFAGSEGGSSLSGLNGTLSMAKVLLVFRPSFAVSLVGTSTFLEETTDSNPSSQSIAAAGEAAPLIRLASGSVGNSATAPAFTTGTFDATVTRVGSNSGVRAGYAIQNTTPSSNTVDIGDNGSGNILISGWMNFT
jgi:hypothetical protein